MKVPLYRLRNNVEHFYTTSAEERDNAVTQYGYTEEGIACYVDLEADPVPYFDRDHCACMALAALIQCRAHAGGYVGDVTKQATIDSKLAYIYADAMIKARDK